MKPTSPRSILITCTTLAALAGCSSEPSEAATKSVAPFQTDLIELAFRAASEFPRDPHIKNRCRTQEGVVAACLELGLTRQALTFTQRIENWRGGLCYANLAHYCVDHGIGADVDAFLRKALEIAENSITGTESQTWRRDRIRARVATVYSMKGQRERGQRLAAGLGPTERGILVVDEARSLTDDGFEAALALTDQVIAGGNFEAVRAQLQKCAALYERYFDDPSRREALERRVCDPAMHALPAAVRIQLITSVARTAAQRGDAAKALELVARADRIRDAIDWSPEHRLPLDAALARVEHAAMSTDAAVRRLDASVAFFDANRQRTINMYRGGALRPIAAAYHEVGRTHQAWATYDKVLDEALENPNSRPRAIDLAETCCSLAVHGIEPSVEFMDRLRRIYEDLDHPW